MPTARMATSAIATLPTTVCTVSFRSGTRLMPRYTHSHGNMRASRFNTESCSTMSLGHACARWRTLRSAGTTSQNASMRITTALSNKSSRPRLICTQGSSERTNATGGHCATRGKSARDKAKNFLSVQRADTSARTNHKPHRVVHLSFYTFAPPRCACDATLTAPPVSPPCPGTAPACPPTPAGAAVLAQSRRAAGSQACHGLHIDSTLRARRLCVAFTPLFLGEFR